MSKEYPANMLDENMAQYGTTEVGSSVVFTLLNK